MYASIANGELDWTLSTLGSALPLLNAGRIKLLAIAARERSKSAPDVPTVGEAGGPDFTSSIRGLRCSRRAAFRRKGSGGSTPMSPGCSPIP